MESTMVRSWIMPDPWALPLDHDSQLVDLNPNETAVAEAHAADMDLSALTADFTFDHTLTDSPFSSTISDVAFLDDLDYASLSTSSMESSPRLPGDIADPLAADLSQQQPADLSAWSQSVLRMPPMFDDMILQFPTSDVFSTWPLFPTPPIPNPPIFQSEVDLIGTASMAPGLPPISPIFPCPSCDKVFDAKQKLR
jgi:hypothetical protein